MIPIEFPEKIIDDIEYNRYNFPNPKVQRKMEALYLKSQGLSHGLICKLCRISPVTLVKYLRQYQEGGIERLKLKYLKQYQDNGIESLKTNLYKGKENELLPHK
ncbi:MAG: helix-turn-helix domain-containing protein [Lentisphaerales bacterium]|nr:helix-turn-helix domain-containing protein [Lentisphaerales bacterium]